MKVFFKITHTLLSQVTQDIMRPHSFAYERVGFLACRVGRTDTNEWILLGSSYHPVADDDYLPDETVGALIGPDAIRKALQIGYNNPVSMVHVHMHDHRGMPKLSSTDKREMAKLIPDFWKVRPNLPHAAVVFSKDSVCGYVWEPVSKSIIAIADFTVVDAPLKFIR